MKMEQTECSETSEYKIQTPENYPEENIQYLTIIITKDWKQFCDFSIKRGENHEEIN
jgi:hypothetical protein